ncbi:MAG: hypothetical protein J6A49_03755 [Clostridia bacterium]|nr:hypothetical protein [Clostridia bacterium]
MSKKVLAVILSLILTFSVITVPVGAADIVLPETSIENVFNMFIDQLLSYILKYLNKYWPGYEDKWSTSEDYVPENFYQGEETFDKTVSPDAQWKVGYAGASLLEGIDPMSGDYFLAGSLEPIVGRVPTQVIDDQRVRVYAISDGVSGTVVHAVIDGFGFSRGDVMEIRSRMADFAEKYGVVAINVSVLHQHSCIDTLGMNVPLAQALIMNTGNAATGGLLDDQKVQKNQQFMENLFTKTVYAMKRAVVNMKTGDLYYGSVDVADYIKDKRDPQAIDSEIQRLRFVPEDGTGETWILEAGIHCTSIGAGPEELTADYPYYIEKTIREEIGANVVFVQGAELAITTREILLCGECDSIANVAHTDDGVEISCPNGCGEVAFGEDIGEANDIWYQNNIGDKNDFETMAEYGYILAQKVIAIEEEEKLDPVLNIAMQEVALDVDNQILTLAAREDVLNAVITKAGDGYNMITEIGYMELGNSVAVFLCPGEFDPILIYGGPESGDASWTGGEWAMPALKDCTNCENVMVFGLCNDQAGYVLRDNEYHSLLTENEEVNVISKSAGSTFVNSFMDLLKETEEAA